MTSTTEVKHLMHLALIGIKGFTKIAFHGVLSKLRIIFISDYYYTLKLFSIDFKAVLIPLSFII